LRYIAAVQTPWWWRDAIVLGQLQVVFSAVGVLLAGAAVLYAWRVARKQFAVMDDQTAISKKQMELAERQDQIIQRQLARQAVLNVEIRSASYSFTDNTMTVHREEYHLYLVNSGNKAAKDVYFRVVVPWETEYRPQFAVLENSVSIRNDEEWLSETERNLYVEGRHHGPIYPAQAVMFVTVSVEVPHVPYQTFRAEHRFETCEYRLEWEDGRTPSVGYVPLQMRTINAREPDNS